MPLPPLIPACCKTPKFCNNSQIFYFPGVLRLQKLDAKAYLFAGTFANQQAGRNMKIGYARVSTLDQHLELQLQALTKARCTKIFREKVSGTSRSRPELQRLLEQLRAGD